MSKERYHRQFLLPQIKAEGQERLARARVLCVGAGGLGSPALLYLAAAGVGNLSIVDDDRISLSNLQRQILFETKDLGEPKAVKARERLLTLNPEIKVDALMERLDSRMAERIFGSFDVVIDGSDNFETKFLCNDACVKFGVPLVYGSVLQFEGQVAVFDARKGPCYRCLFPVPPKAAIPNCAEAGVLGAVAGMIGAVQALEAIKVILGNPELPPLIGKLAVLDAIAFSWSKLELRRNARCAVCSLAPDQIRLEDEPQVCVAGDAESYSPESVTRLHPVMLIDLREEDELGEGMISGALHWAFSKIEQRDFPSFLATESAGTETVLYCQSGVRSRKALSILREAGYWNLKELRGGIQEWRKKGFPLASKG